MTTITRGNVVSFSTTFVDVNDDPVTVASATIHINFKNTDGQRDTAEVSMSSDGDGWIAEWDSTDARPCTVYWSAKGETPHCAEDGSFTVVANKANLSDLA